MKKLIIILILGLSANVFGLELPTLPPMPMVVNTPAPTIKSDIETRGALTSKASISLPLLKDVSLVTNGYFGDRVCKFDDDGNLLFITSNGIEKVDNMGNSVNVESVTFGKLDIKYFGKNSYFSGGADTHYKYYTDSVGNYIQGFDYCESQLNKYDLPDGNIIKLIRENIDKDQCKDFPFTLSEDSIGNIFVGRKCKNNIEKFSPNGKSICKWGGQGLGDGKFINIQLLKIDWADNVYILDKPTENSYRFQKFDASGKFLFAWKSESALVQSFPLGKSAIYDIDLNEDDIAFDGNGNIYVLETDEGLIKKFDLLGNPIKQFGEKMDDEKMYKANLGMEYVKFVAPNKILVNKMGDIFVWDNISSRTPWNTEYIKMNCIKKLNSDGVIKQVWGSQISSYQAKRATDIKQAERERKIKAHLTTLSLKSAVMAKSLSINPKLGYRSLLKEAEYTLDSKIQIHKSTLSLQDNIGYPAMDIYYFIFSTRGLNPKVAKIKIVLVNHSNDIVNLLAYAPMMIWMKGDNSSMKEFAHYVPVEYKGQEAKNEYAVYPGKTGKYIFNYDKNSIGNSGMGPIGFDEIYGLILKGTLNFLKNGGQAKMCCGEGGKFKLENFNKIYP